MIAPAKTTPPTYLEQLEEQLSQREIQFCDLVMQGREYADAYIEAGYPHSGSRWSAERRGYAIAHTGAVKSYLAERRRDLRLRMDSAVTEERWIREQARIAFLDPRGVFTPDGQLRGIHAMPDAVAAAIKKVKVVTKHIPKADGEVEVEYVHEIEFWDKGKALDAIGRNLGLYQADRTNDKEIPGAALATLFGRYIAALHLTRGMSVADAMQLAERDPEAMHAWGREVGLLASGERQG